MATTKSDHVDRRQFGLGLTAIGASLLARPALAAGRASIVVIGGGPAGATVAGTVKLTNPSLDVALIEPQRYYTTCFMSNYYMGGMRTRASLTHSYEGLGAAGTGASRGALIGSQRRLRYSKAPTACPGGSIYP